MKKITLLLALIITSYGFSQNLITNGDFESGVTGWSGNAANVVTENGNSYNAATVMTAGNPWDVNLSYVLPLSPSGTAYRLTFDAWSDVTRPLIAGVGLNQDPWTNVTSTVNLTTTSQTFVLNFISNFASPTSRIIFDMGNAAGFVGIDNVILEVVTTTCNNGVQDGDETGVDCGGSCAPCVPAPLVAAPTPPARPAADVISLFSDAYSNIVVNTWGTDWGPSAATITDFTAGGNAAKVINLDANKVFAGVDFAAQKFDATSFTHFHLDYWTANPIQVGQVISIKLSNHDGPEETSAIQTNPTPQGDQWVSLDIPLASFTAAAANGLLTRNAIAQLVITAARADNGIPLKIYMDNIYFHKNTVLSNTNFDLVSFKVYPNPASNNVNISSSNTIENVSLYTVIGQEILTKTGNSNEMNIDISNLQKGVYLLKAQIDGQVKTTRIIKE